MPERRSSTALVALALAVAAALIGLWWFAGSEGAPPADVSVIPAPGDSVSPGPSVEEPSLAPLDPRRGSTAPSGAPTTVLFPLRVELELLVPGDLPEVPTGPRLGAGRTARLMGQIADASGLPAQATVRFVAGPNAGRELRTDSTGAFGAGDLYPGVDIVEVRGPSILGSRREVRLAERKETLLHIGYGRPGSVEGRVVSGAGSPVEGARVLVDNQSAITGENGFFSATPIAPGPVLLEVFAEGFAPQRREIGVMAGTVVPASSLTIVLEEGSSLELILGTNVGGPGPAVVYLEPAVTHFARPHNWAAIRAIEVGEHPVTVRDLPAGPAILRAFRPGAQATPPTRQVSLPAGGATQVTLEFRAAPRVHGRVVQDGRVVAGARVRLSAADVPRATLLQAGGTRAELDEEVRALLPSVSQASVTDNSGRFEFTSYEDISPYRLLEVVSADGSARATRAVGPGEVDVEIELTDRAQGQAELVLHLSERFQGLPVELVVASAPREPTVLAAAEPLVIDGLAPGLWRLDVTWWGETVRREDALEIRGGTRLDVVLPPGAIEGQDEETWTRAGETFPGG